jgi:hypothetical protein
MLSGRSRANLAPGVGEGGRSPGSTSRGNVAVVDMREELARNTADIEHSGNTGEGDRHWSAACATFWHPTRWPDQHIRARSLNRWSTTSAGFWNPTGFSDIVLAEDEARGEIARRPGLREGRCVGTELLE